MCISLDRICYLDSVQGLILTRSITVSFDQIVHEYGSITSHLEFSAYTGNWQRWNYFQQLLATANGRYDFGQANLNEMVDAKDGVELVPERFVDWLRRIWMPRFQSESQSATMAID